MAKKVLLIVRASTEQQEIESQQRELVQYVSNFGYKESDCVIIAVAGASARKKNAKYLQMLEDVKTTIISDSEIKAVALWNLDRLGRVDDSLIEMKNWFINHQIQLICKSPALVLLNEDGSVNGGAEIAYGVFASLVKQQTEDLFNKWTRGKARNSKDGKFNGGQCAPFGYTVDSNGYIVPDAAEAAIVVQINEMYASGKYSQTSILKELQDRGFKGKKGGEISYSLVRSILTSTLYTGQVQERGRQYPPIITEELYGKVKAVREGNTISTKESVNHNLCAGLIKCPNCGHTYVGTTRQYRCLGEMSWKRYGMSEKCFSPQLNKTAVDTFAWSVVRAIHIRYRDEYFKTSKAEFEAEKAAIMQKMQKTSSVIEKLENSFNRAKTLFIQGDIDEKEYAKIRQQNTAKMDAEKAVADNYERQLSDINNKLKLCSSKESFVMAWSELEEADEVKKQEIARMHITQIVPSDRVKIDGKIYQPITITDKLGDTHRFAYQISNGHILQCLYIYKEDELVHWYIGEQRQKGDIEIVKES